MAIRTPIKNLWIDPPFDTLKVNATEFSFGYTEQNGKSRKYKIQSTGTPESKEALHTMLWALRDAQKNSYRPPWKEFRKLKNNLKITNLNDNAEQLSFLACTRSFDKIASALERVGLIDQAYRIDILANTLEKNWYSNSATLFFDEMENQGIEPTTAKKVLDIAESYKLW
jgi:hypothetical protein